MSVASKNQFALLNDNEGDVVDKAPVVDKGTTEAPKPNRKPSSTRGGRYYQRGTPKPVVNTPPAAEGEPKSPTGNTRNYNRGDRGDRPPRGDRGERGERGEYRGRGGRGRGGGGRGRGDRDPRPDRHSATGIVDTAKKVGSGWGNAESEYKDETNAAADAQAGDAWGAGETTNADGADPWAEPAPTGDATEAKDDKPAGEDEGRKRKKYEDEEDEGKMTLDEYKAKAAASETIPKLELRQVNEGESEIFKEAKQLTKDPDANNYFVGKQAKSSGAPRARKEAKQYIEIEARFEPPSRGGRGRGRGGGRGDYRGGGGERPNRGDRGGRNQQQQQRSVDVDDTTAFPSL